MPTTTLRARYGTITLGHVDPRTNRRADRYTRAEDGEESCASAFATGSRDVSNHHRTYPNGYDGRCSCCWLGFAHTEDYHLRGNG